MAEIILKTGQRLVHPQLEKYIADMKETKDALQAAIDDLKDAVKNIDGFNSTQALVCIRRATNRMYSASEIVALNS